MDVMKGADIMRAGILDGFQTIIPTAAAVLSEKRQILRLTQQEVADRAKITLRASSLYSCRNAGKLSGLSGRTDR